VVTLNRAVAIWKLRGAEAALERIAPLSESLDGYFYFHGVRATLLEGLGRKAEARDAFGRAIALANTPAEALLIRQHLDRLEGEGPA
jgi:RNA polymerase sigma-70 factor (ECF subfamily)